MFIAAVLLASIPLAIAAPVGISESATVKAAKSWIGVKTMGNGNSRSGIDCSHLVYQVYKQVGAKGISFMTVPQIKKSSYYKVISPPRPGDIILWKKDVTQNGKKYYLATHVGIYIGNNQFIHEWNVAGKVTTSSISGIFKTGQPYYERWSKK